MTEMLIYMYDRLSKRISKKIPDNELLEKIKQEIDANISDIPILWKNMIYEFLFVEPMSYWNREIAECTFNGLEKLYLKSDIFSDASASSLSHFFISYFTYKELVTIINDLSLINENNQIKTRMYRIPTYVSLVEGCLSNLFKYLRDIIDLYVEKDLKSQTKLNGLCTIMNTYGFEKLTHFVDVDLRNAISHGGVYITDKESHFSYFKNGTPSKKIINNYDFDKLIEDTLDSIGGIFIGIIRFYSKYNGSLQNIDKIMEQDSFLKHSFAKILFSTPDFRCMMISLSPNEEQINFDINSTSFDHNEIVTFIIEISIIARSLFTSYTRYFFSISNERMMPGWIRFTAEEIDSLLNKQLTFTDVVESATRRGDIMLWDHNDADIDLDIIKHFRFPLITKKKWSVRNIDDCSLPDSKRIKAHLFIKEQMPKKDIIRAVNDAIRELKKLYTPPNPMTVIKHGDVPADSVFLTVYFGNKRVRNRSVLPSNPSFLLKAEYSVTGTSILKNGGLPKWLWDQLIKEQSGNILYAWNPNFYI
ncbi:hypothetical protein [Brevibacillus sp. FSL K6-2834]|uniref:hypothetical protein n=1 Tax=Brevibacillus sp. FSL K6-2834 TaxID=2954680 RepID=UPI0031585A1D